MNVLLLILGAPKPPGSQQMTSPQKGKQLRVPKPTAKYDNKLTITLKLVL